MSKRQFAECLVDRFCTDNEVVRDDAYNHIAESSTLAVALEYLGELSGDNLWYAKQRGGCAFVYFDKNPAILTIREIMSFLPDEYVVYEQ